MSAKKIIEPRDDCDLGAEEVKWLDRVIAAGNGDSLLKRLLDMLRDNAKDGDMSAKIIFTRSQNVSHADAHRLSARCAHD
jgi:hypothetical protein